MSREKRSREPNSTSEDIPEVTEVRLDSCVNDSRSAELNQESSCFVDRLARRQQEALSGGTKCWRHRVSLAIIAKKPLQNVRPPPITLVLT
jgi:hypothetical protein